jgi:hypothetical protein
MMAYLLLQGLDITYTILGHLVQSDGSVIGVITEPEVGRLVQFRDRSLVYDAISRLQQRKLIYNGIHYSKIHILHGKVRLSNLASIRYFGDPVELNKQAGIRHWQALEELFKFLDRDDVVPELALERHLMHYPIQLLPDIPSPELPPLMRLICATFVPEEFQEWRSQRMKDRARKSVIIAVSADLVDGEALEADKEDSTDLPLGLQRTRHHTRRRMNPSSHSHDRRRRLRRLMLESSDVNDDVLPRATIESV